MRQRRDKYIEKACARVGVELEAAGIADREARLTDFLLWCRIRQSDGEALRELLRVCSHAARAASRRMREGVSVDEIASSLAERVLELCMAEEEAEERQSLEPLELAGAFRTSFDPRRGALLPWLTLIGSRLDSGRHSDSLDDDAVGAALKDRVAAPETVDVWDVDDEPSQAALMRLLDQVYLQALELTALLARYERDGMSNEDVGRIVVGQRAERTMANNRFLALQSRSVVGCSVLRADGEPRDLVVRWHDDEWLDNRQMAYLCGEGGFLESPSARRTLFDQGKATYGIPTKHAHAVFNAQGAIVVAREEVMSALATIARDQALALRLAETLPKDRRTKMLMAALQQPGDALRRAGIMPSGIQHVGYSSKEKLEAFARSLTDISQLIETVERRLASSSFVEGVALVSAYASAAALRARLQLLASTGVNLDEDVRVYYLADGSDSTERVAHVWELAQNKDGALRLAIADAVGHKRGKIMPLLGFLSRGEVVPHER
ncbi:MAG: hypothetical protein FD171_2157 [Actinobacteria bacterium]|nr:MAG: hypothetical protein FD171_2157 [Actinomycetota bacterium]